MPGDPKQAERLVCTECGWPRVMRRRVWWKRPWVPAAVFAVALVGYAVFNFRGVAVSSGGELPRFVEPGVSAAEVAAILAAGRDESDARAAEIVGAVLESSRPNPRSMAVGPMVVHAAFGPASAPIDESWGFGWPSSWITGQATYIYDDAMNRAGRQVAQTNPAKRLAGKWEDTSDPRNTPPRRLVEMWGMSVVISPAPEQTAGVLRRWHVRLDGLAVVLSVAVLMWFVVGWIAARRWRDSTGSRRVHRTQLLAVTGCAAVFLLMGALTTQSRSRLGVPQWIKSSQQGIPPAPIYWLNEPCAATGLTSADIERALAEPGGTRRVLRAVADVAPVSGLPESSFLALAIYPTAWVMPSTSTSNAWYPDIGFPVVWFTSVEMTRHTLAGEPGPFETTPGVAVNWLNGGITIRQDRGAEPTRSVWIGVESLSVLVLGLCAITLMYRGALGWRPAIRRRRGLCPVCAYPLQAERESAGSGVAS